MVESRLREGHYLISGFLFLYIPKYVSISSGARRELEAQD